MKKYFGNDICITEELEKDSRIYEIYNNKEYKSNFDTNKNKAQEFIGDLENYSRKIDSIDDF